MREAELKQPAKLAKRALALRARLSSPHEVAGGVRLSMGRAALKWTYVGACLQRTQMHRQHMPHVESDGCGSNKCTKMAPGKWNQRLEPRSPSSLIWSHSQVVPRFQVASPWLSSTRLNARWMTSSPASLTDLLQARTEPESEFGRSVGQQTVWAFRPDGLLQKGC